MSFVMPTVEVGEMVVWYPDGIPSRADRPVPAAVTAASERTLCLAVFLKDADCITPMDGVRHLKDPDLSKPDVRLTGAWDYGPERRARMALEETIKSVKGK